MNADIDQEKIQELQIIEQNLQQISLQKQAFQFEIDETENALEEIKDSKDDIFKIVGQIMVKAKKESIERDLRKKFDILKLRMKTLEKQEETLDKKSEEIRKDVAKSLSKKADKKEK